MTRALRRILAFWIAAAAAISILLGPANATAMLDCDTTQTDVVHEAGLDHHGSEFHAKTPTADHDRPPHEHPESHCANHVCVVAIQSGHGLSDDALKLILAEHDASARSLVALTSPDGLRRPPRT